MSKNNFLLIGAGAIAEQLYIKVFNKTPNFSLTVIDKDISRIKYLKEKYPECNFSSANFQEVVIQDTFSGGFICLPNHLHATFIQLFIDQGIPVLVEKPVVIFPAEFESITFSENSKVYVAQLRRFFESSQFLYKLIRANIFGSVIRIDISDGGVFDWKLQSDYLLSKAKSGGGVLIDSGVHWIDFLIWCLGELTLTKYDENSEGGVESECVVQFSFSSGSGALRMSRIRKVSRYIHITFKDAQVKYNLDTPGKIAINMNKEPDININHTVDDSLHKAFSMQLEAYFSKIAITESREDLNILPSADEALKPVEFIHLCYESIA